ncbi:unnamed protein product [Nesidiocoris tenuis]|uniref:Carbonic anhydrase n=1 Tax=Nesidiocoris tenuis TaxID=355587 RepID=A0A6H5HA23_9HEMI|nr:unnamed protein product [Nesidiocoris tenuis]
MSRLATRTGFILMRHYPVRPRYVSATQLLFEIDEGFLLVMLMCFDFFFCAVRRTLIKQMMLIMFDHSRMIKSIRQPFTIANKRYRRSVEMELIDTDGMKWAHIHANPLNLKMSNTGYTVTMNASYAGLFTPTLEGGILLSPYKFAQLHFHWSQDNETGSEHRVEGEGYPLEAHVVLFNSDHETFENAIAKENGVAILVYFFEIHETSSVQQLTKHLRKVKEPYSQFPLDTISLSSIFPAITSDIVTYFGHMANQCNHGVLWLISRTTLAITEDELAQFRSVKLKFDRSAVCNSRAVAAACERKIFILDSSAEDKDKVLHPLPGAINPKRKAVQEKIGDKRASRKSSRRASRRASRRQSKRASKK